MIGVPLSSRCEPVSRDPYASLFVRLAAMAWRVGSAPPPRRRRGVVCLCLT